MVDTVRTRGPYAKSKRVRAAVLDAAADVFAESGFRSTTMKEVAERAGISEGGLAHHFRSKDELLAQVLERREQQAAAHIPRTGGIDALLALLKIVAEDSHKPGIVELHSLLSAEATSPEHPAHVHYLERYESVRLFATRAFRALEEAGELDSPMTAEQLGASYIALSDGLQLQWLYDRNAVSPTDTLRAFLQSVVPACQTGSSG